MRDKEQDKCSFKVGANTQSRVYPTRCAVDRSGAKAKTHIRDLRSKQRTMKPDKPFCHVHNHSTSDLGPVCLGSVL